MAMKMKLKAKVHDVAGEARDGAGRWTAGAAAAGGAGSLFADEAEDASHEETVRNSVQVLARSGSSTLAKIVGHSGLSPRDAMTALDGMLRSGKIIQDGRTYRLGAKLGGKAGGLQMAAAQPQLGFDLGKSHIPAYTRHTADGKAVYVPAHEDKRTKKAPAQAAARNRVPARPHEDDNRLPGAASLEEDYRANGTKARSFLSWFGDWTRQPKGTGNVSQVRKENGEPQETHPVTPSSSRVVGKNGKPTVVYHGTSGPEFRAWDPQKADTGALMGPGFYFTEDREIAESYQKKGQDTATLSMPRPKAIKLLKERVAESNLAGDTKRRVDRMCEEVGTGYVNRQAFEHFGIKADDVYAAKDTGHVMELYLNIRNPFDADKDRIPWDAIPPAGQKKLQKAGAKPGQGVLWAAFSDVLTPNVGNTILRRLGFDGVTHIGGQIMGSGEHRVWVAFQPTQIKATKNNGHFNPADPDMYKAAAADVAREPRVPKGQAHGGEWVKLAAGAPHPEGHAPSTAAQRAVIKDRGLAPIPPTSWGLVTAHDPQERVQATWYDQKGRKQYRYSQAHTDAAADAKFDKIHHLQGMLPSIRKQLGTDLKQEGVTKERAAAAIVSIIDATAMRVGSEDYAAENDTYGASSLRKEHVQVVGKCVQFSFPGKHTREWQRKVCKPTVTAAVKEFLALPGDRLFQYEQPDGKVTPLDETKVNAYLRRFGVTAKQFRTYHASRLAAEHLAALGAPRDETEARAQITKVVKDVADFLGNTPAVCRGSYINPLVLSAYAAGELKAEAFKSLLPTEVAFGKLLDHLAQLVAAGRITEHDPFAEVPAGRDPGRPLGKSMLRLGLRTRR